MRAVMKAQLASPGFTHIYAALVAVVNTKLPEVGELLLKRVSPVEHRKIETYKYRHLYIYIPLTTDPHSTPNR